MSPNPRTLRLLIDFASLALSFSAALVAYFFSTFLGSVVGAGRVDLLFAAAAAAALVLFPGLIRLMESIGRGRSTFWVSLLHLGSLVLLALPAPSGVIASAFVLYNVTLLGTLYGLDVILEKYSQDHLTGSIRGRHLAILNLGWLPAPWIAGWLFERYGFSTLALVSALFIFPVVAILGSHFFGHGLGQPSREGSVFSSARVVFQSRPLRYALLVAVMLQVFYAIMVIETPLVLRGLGFTPGVIGIMFTIMLLPFVLFQYPLGRIADRRWGEKEILFCGFAVASISVLLLAWLMGSPWAASFLLWAALLFLSRIGAASIEVMRDTYFFKHVDSHDLPIIALLWSAMPVAYLLAPLVSNLLLRASGSYTAVFTTLGIVLLLTAATLTRMPDTK